VFSQNPAPPGVKALPAGFTIPPQDLPCILPGHRLDIQCFVKNDPDAIRIRAEEAALEAQALAAAQSGTLDPFHQVETLGQLEIFDPNNENMTIGKLGLSSAEEDDFVAFLETLTDGFVKPSSVAASTPASLTRKTATPPKP
jgi:hypothetical protein